MLARTLSIASLVGLLIGHVVLAEDKASQVDKASTLTIDGQQVRVFWNDGDSFRILDQPDEGRSTRLTGYNTLENHGPVHRWDDWTAAELFRVSEESTAAAAAGNWTCSTQGSHDRYGRSLVTCRDLILSMVSTGLGHLFLIGDEATKEELEAQRMAQKKGLGMWAKGVPDFIVTSLHSASESNDPDRIFNRVVSTADGKTEQIFHKETYAVCQEVCLRGSCMVYVPYEKRWNEDKAECLEP